MTVQIELSQGREAIVSDEDIDLADFKWCVSRPNKGTAVYAVHNHRENSKRSQWSLSRIIMERILGHAIPPGLVVDYRNKNTLDCTRSNLRTATRAELAMRRKRKSGIRRIHKGAKFRPNSPGRPYIAVIGFRKKQVRIGQFATSEEAHAAYVKKAIELYGEFGEEE